MNEKKPWWTSKTVWAGAAGLLSSVLVYFSVETTPAEVGAIANGLTSSAAIIFRIVSKKELSLS